MQFKKEQTEVAQPELYKPIDRVLHGEVWAFLEVLAMDLHKSGNRDFTGADVDRLGFAELWARLEPHVKSYSVPVLMRLEVDPSSTFNRSSNQKAVSGAAKARFMYRFIHLTFQEFFVARRLLTLLSFSPPSPRAAPIEAPKKKSRFGELAFPIDQRTPSILSALPLSYSCNPGVKWVI